MNDDSQVTLKDVARKADVSVSTVSRVIRGKPYVRESTRECVLLAVKRLNYRPSRIARSLKRGQYKTETICLLLSDPRRRISEPFFIEFLAGVTDAAAEAKYDLLIATKFAEKPLDETMERILHSQLSDGIIHVGRGANDAVISTCQRNRMPVVIYDEPLGKRPCAYVAPDNRGGARMVTEYLLSLGHRQIAFIGGLPNSSASRAREEGFRRTMEAYGLRVLPEFVRSGLFAQETGYREMRDILQGSPRPTAVFAASDTIAFGVMNALREAGLCTPHDISVVGFDDIPQASNAHPLLTTVRQPIRSQGFEAAKMLLTLIQGSDAPVANKVFPVELIVRQSCGKPRSVQEDEF